MATMTIGQELQVRDKLTAERKQLMDRLGIVNGQLRGLKRLGRYRPQAILQGCSACGKGPFSARELRTHKCERPNG